VAINAIKALLCSKEYWYILLYYSVFCWRDLRESDHLEDTGVDGRIILKCIFKK